MKRMLMLLILLPAFVLAGPVNINEADAAAISEALSGIGPKKAAAIVQYRTEHGRFQSVKDLENVPGIGAKTLEAISKDILLGDEGAKEGAEANAGAATPAPAK